MTSEIKPLPVLWHWVTENGAPQQGGREELAEQLASGALPGFALVWRAGWGEWLPAMQVAELASALPFAPPSERRSAVPASDPNAVPPVPISEYPRLRLLAKQALRLSRPPAGVVGLREGGAARALQTGVAVEFDCPEREVVTSPLPDEALLEAARVMTEPSPPLDLGLEAALDAPASGRRAPSPTPPDARLATPASRPALPLVAEFGLEELIDPTPKRSWALWLRAHGLWVAVGTMVFWLIISFAARWLSVPAAPEVSLAPQRAPETALQPLAAARASAAAAREVPVLGCRLRRPAQKLDDWAVADVRPGLFSSPEAAPSAAAPSGAGAAGAGMLSVAYAQGHQQAVGGTLDLGTLRFRRDFAEREDYDIFSVMPFGSAGVGSAGSAGAGAVSYRVEHRGIPLAYGRVVDGVPPLRLGMRDAALVVGPLERRPEKVWDLPVGAIISVPEVAAHPLGFTLATRVGRSNGSILVGALSRSGAALSRLESVGPAGADYSRPALASGPEQTLLAVVRRADAERGSALLVARAPNGQLPLVLEPLDLFEASAAEPVAPAIAALPDGGFVLMWSQGEGWRRQVRVQRLSSELVPMGAALDLTTADPALLGATPGAMLWVDQQLIALHFVRREEGQSLWASSLGCGS